LPQLSQVLDVRALGGTQCISELPDILSDVVSAGWAALQLTLAGHRLVRIVDARVRWLGLVVRHRSISRRVISAVVRRGVSMRSLAAHDPRRLLIRALHGSREHVQLRPVMRRWQDAHQRARCFDSTWRMTEPRRTINNPAAIVVA
jgi:hypothetical protein